MLRSRIFEGIHALRLRKCRPDRETIAHYVLKKYGTQFNEIFNELELIVDEELLVKVEYKGSVSYRLPSSFGTTTNTKASPLLTKHSKILNSVKTTRFILEAVNDLLSQNESYSIAGIPLGELKTHLEKLAPERFENERSLIAIERELLSKNGNLLKSPRGRIYPKDLPIPGDDELEAAGLTIPDEEPEVKKPNSRAPRSSVKNKRESGTGTGSRKRKSPCDADAETPAPAVIAVKSKPEIQENIQAAVRKTYEGKYFTLVGSDGAEPASATANANADSEEEEKETEAESESQEEDENDEENSEENVQESTVDLSQIFDIETPTPVPVPVPSSPLRTKKKGANVKTAKKSPDTSEAANGSGTRTRGSPTRASTRTTRNQSKR